MRIFHKKQAVSENALISRTEGIVATEFAEGLFLVDENAGRLYHLNVPGSAIWSKLEKPMRVSEVCNQLVNEFSSNKDEICRDVFELLDELLAKRLIKVSGGSQGQSPT